MTGIGWSQLLLCGLGRERDTSVKFPDVRRDGRDSFKSKIPVCKAHAGLQTDRSL